MTDAGLVHLRGLANLRSLSLIDTRVSDAGLVYVQGLNLRSLNLGSVRSRCCSSGTEAVTQVTDAGLVHLSGLANLRTLFLARTQVTDAGLGHLRGLANLQSLVLLGTQTTEAGRASLRLALPDCRITPSD